MKKSRIQVRGKGGNLRASGPSLSSFLDELRETEFENLKDLAQTSITSVCTTEATTRGYLTGFLEGVKQKQDPILAMLKTELGNNSQQFSEVCLAELTFLQKLVSVVGHITTLVPWKKPYGDCVNLVMKILILPILEIQDTQHMSPMVILKLEAFETVAKFTEVYGKQTSPFLPTVVPFLESHFQAISAGKTELAKGASDLLGVILLTKHKLFSYSSLVDILAASFKIFFVQDTLVKKLEQIDLIGHIAKKILQITKSGEQNPGNFPLQDIGETAEFLATKIFPFPEENLETWFESSISVFALLAGVSAKCGSVDFNGKIAALSFRVFVEQLKQVKHTTKAERLYNISLVQAIGQSVQFSDNNILQLYLEDYYKELKNFNIHAKKYAASNDVKLVKQYYQKLRSTIIRTLAPIMKAMNDFTPFADQFLKETAKELADPIILADFIEALGDRSEKFLARVLKPLFSQLERETTSLTLKKNIVDTLARIITQTKSDFLPYLDQCARALQPAANLALETEFCVPFISLYTVILTTFSQVSQIEIFIPRLLQPFLDILSQEISDAAPPRENPDEEVEEMDLLPLIICEALTNLKTILSNEPLTEKIIQIFPSFLPELIIYLSDHIPKEIVFDDDSFIRIAQLELVQQLLALPDDEAITTGLYPILSLILQNIELNTNEIDVQVVSFDTARKFLARIADDAAPRTRVRAVCEGTLLIAHEHKQLKASIQQLLGDLGE